GARRLSGSPVVLRRVNQGLALLLLVSAWASLGDKAPAISSTKSLSGHSLGAAGVHEAIYCMLMMEGNFIAGSANIDELDPEVADLPVLRETRENAKIDTVMSNSFGFGGTNATLVLKRWAGK
ncbi:hypothetical protein ACQKLJ_20080, partial [Pseudomonas qingdaonensis]